MVRKDVPYFQFSLLATLVQVFAFTFTFACGRKSKNLLCGLPLVVKLWTFIEHSWSPNN